MRLYYFFPLDHYPLWDQQGWHLWWRVRAYFLLVTSGTQGHVLIANIFYPSMGKYKGTPGTLSPPLFGICCACEWLVFCLPQSNIWVSKPLKSAEPTATYWSSCVSYSRMNFSERLSQQRSQSNSEAEMKGKVNTWKVQMHQILECDEDVLGLYQDIP